ncbi:MAG: hypothetical protein VB032_05995 [Burkholderiaceae bacterium]|nr:hypothetical protein [Burkholderiaceae bacterium]
MYAVWANKYLQIDGDPVAGMVISPGFVWSMSKNMVLAPQIYWLF